MHERKNAARDMFSYNIDELTRQGRKLWNLSISQSRCVNKQLALCPFCGLDLLRNDGGEDTETLRGKALLPLSLHSQRCKEKRNSSKCMCQRFFFPRWDFCHFFRPEVPVIKRAAPVSLSPQGPKCLRGQTKGWGAVRFARGFIISSHMVPLLWTLKEAEHGKKGRAEQNCSLHSELWEGEREGWGNKACPQCHTFSSHIPHSASLFQVYLSMS